MNDPNASPSDGARMAQAMRITLLVAAGAALLIGIAALAFSQTWGWFVLISGVIIGAVGLILRVHSRNRS
jgi:hypothetical protein